MGSPGDAEGETLIPLPVFISFPPLPLHKFWQQERDGQSHDKRAFGRLRVEIILGWLPSPRCSHIVRRPIVSPSSSTMSIGRWNYSPGADGNGWTYQPSSWYLPAWQSSHCVCHAGLQAARLTFKSPSTMGKQPFGHAIHACLMCVNVVRSFGEI
jgi:hypothetical protein